MNWKHWKVTFAYSGTSKREFFDKEFKIAPGENIDFVINEFVKIQNRGEAKSDRIRYWSKTELSTGAGSIES